MGCCQGGAGALPREISSGESDKRREKRDRALIFQKIYHAPVLKLQENLLYLKRKQQVGYKKSGLSEYTSDTNIL
jgi:hypothetical protein